MIGSNHKWSYGGPTGPKCYHQYLQNIDKICTTTATYSICTLDEPDKHTYILSIWWSSMILLSFEYMLHDEFHRIHYVFFFARCNKLHYDTIYYNLWVQMNELCIFNFIFCRVNALCNKWVPNLKFYVIMCLQIYLWVVQPCNDKSWRVEPIC